MSLVVSITEGQIERRSVTRIGPNITIELSMVPPPRHWPSRSELQQFGYYANTCIHLGAPPFDNRAIIDEIVGVCRALGCGGFARIDVMIAKEQNLAAIRRDTILDELRSAFIEKN